MSDVKTLYSSESLYPKKAISYNDKPKAKAKDNFPIVEIDTLRSDEETEFGFGLKVWIDGKKVFAPQKCEIIAGSEDFTMVRLEFPAIIKKHDG